MNNDRSQGNALATLRRMSELEVLAEMECRIDAKSKVLSYTVTISSVTERNRA